MADILNALRRFDALRDGDTGGDVVKQRVLESIAPTYAEDSVIPALGNRLRTALDKRGIKRLYLHQSEAIAQALQGANVVLQAPTASGKTLAFQIPDARIVAQAGCACTHALSHKSACTGPA